MSPEDSLALALEYRATGDPQLRNRLVMACAPLVKYIVYRKVRQLPAHCEVDDLLSCGLEALVTSIDRFDPDKGVTLEHFVWTRIHGAVIDELRQRDWAPRSLRAWERDITAARAEFRLGHRRKPTGDELAAMMAISPDTLDAKLAQIARSDLTSLNCLVPSEDGTDVERIDTLEDADDRHDPERASTVLSAKARFRTAFATLPRREREIAVLRYVKDLTLNEIGQVMGISESRVCQIHTKTKRRLRAELAEHEDLLMAVA